MLFKKKTLYCYPDCHLPMFANILLTQSSEKVNQVRSKGNVSTLLFMSCFGVVYFKVDVFRKEYNNVNFMGNDLERRLYDT